MSAYVIPTDAPESDGTFEWDRTTLIIVQAYADGTAGLGYTYGDLAAAGVISHTLADHIIGCDAMDVPRAWVMMNQAIRNAGRPGIGAGAIAAVDAALWDLKARLRS